MEMNCMGVMRRVELIYLDRHQQKAIYDQALLTLQIPKTRPSLVGLS
jgi:hypothetical protein